MVYWLVNIKLLNSIMTLEANLSKTNVVLFRGRYKLSKFAAVGINAAHLVASNILVSYLDSKLI